MVHAAVHGARGYLGRELVRILLQHPDVDGVVPVSSTAAGEGYGAHVPAFRHTGLVLRGPDDGAARDADVHFLALAHGEAGAMVPSLVRHGARLIIDLSRDHRASALRGEDGWSYGLADLRPVPRGQRLVANPGCYPTAAALAAAPVLRAGLAGDGAIIVDGKSGVSGAGATPRADLHFPEQNEALRAYKVLGHDHGPEIRMSLAAERQATKERRVRFTPHLVPMNRGLLATVYVPLAGGTGAEEVRRAYAAYATSAFVHVVPEPDTAHVRGGNHAHVAADADPESGLLVARAAIDNLVKGGSGQAVQNMNDALGLPPTRGLLHIGGAP